MRSVVVIETNDPLEKVANHLTGVYEISRNIEGDIVVEIESEDAENEVTEALNDAGIVAYVYQTA